MSRLACSELCRGGRRCRELFQRQIKLHSGHHRCNQLAVSVHILMRSISVHFSARQRKEKKFLFKFLKIFQNNFFFHEQKISICKNKILASVFIMHLSVNNLIIWFKNILIETQSEYFEHILETNLEEIEFHMQKYTFFFNAKLIYLNSLRLKLLVLFAGAAIQ